MLHGKGMLWITKFACHKMVLERFQPQLRYRFVNQLNTARRFIWNKITITDSHVSVNIWRQEKAFGEARDYQVSLPRERTIHDTGVSGNEDIFRPYN